MRSSDWSSDVCSSDLPESHRAARGASTVEGRRRLSSVGRPLSILELEIRDENARLVPAGTVGEIWVRGDQVSGEYAGRKVIGDDRSEERRVGKEGVSTVRSRWSRYH